MQKKIIVATGKGRNDMDRRCDKCIHHDVCEVYDIVHDPTETSGCRNFLDTNDVVPKSDVEALEKEIERLTGILNAYALQMR